MNPQTPTPKYRPVLTGSQILHLLSLCKKELSDESLSCISILAPFEFKLRNGSISPAYSASPRLALADSLGFSEPSVALSKDHISPAWLYEEWRTNPGGLNLDQLRVVKQYRYENDLMTPDEEQSYETSLIGTQT